MPEQLDPVVAENLASGAMRYLPLTPGNKVICTKRQLQECLVTLAQEAFAMGFLSGQKEHFSSLVLSNVTQRPAWMDIRLDDLNALASHGFRLRPVVVRSLVAAGYCELGDLCWGLRLRTPEALLYRKKDRPSDPKRYSTIAEALGTCAGRESRRGRARQASTKPKTKCLKTVLYTCIVTHIHEEG